MQELSKRAEYPSTARRQGTSYPLAELIVSEKLLEVLNRCQCKDIWIREYYGSSQESFDFLLGTAMTVKVYNRIRTHKLPTKRMIAFKSRWRRLP